MVVVALWSTLRAAVRESGEGRWVWLGVAASIALWGAGQVRYILIGSAFFSGIDNLAERALPLSRAAAAAGPGAASGRPPGRLAPAWRFDVAIVGVLVVFVYLYIGLSFPS